MWTLKKFKTFSAYSSWIDTNKHKYQIEPVFINNAWALEYKPLRVIGA
jgi:hypothetical protein